MENIKTTLVEDSSEVQSEAVTFLRTPKGQTELLTEDFFDRIDLISKNLFLCKKLDDTIREKLLGKVNKARFDGEMSVADYQKVIKNYSDFSLKKYQTVDQDFLREAIEEMINTSYYERKDTFRIESGEALKGYSEDILDHLSQQDYLNTAQLEEVRKRMETVEVQKLNLLPGNKMLRIIFSLHLEPHVAGYYDSRSHRIVIPDKGQANDDLYRTYSDPTKNKKEEKDTYDLALEAYAKTIGEYSLYVHEMIHAAEYRNFIKIPTEDVMLLRRGGVQSYNLREGDRLRSLNEAIVEQINVDICIAKLAERGITEIKFNGGFLELDKARFGVGVYLEERDHLRQLIEKVDFSLFVKAIFDKSSLLDLGRELQSKTGMTLSEVNAKMKKV